MNNNYAEFHDYLSEHVMTPFYVQRLEGLQNLRLQDVLKRKNPYLFKAKNIRQSGDLAKSIVDAFLSSREETLFGNLLEGFAIHVAHSLHGGFKSTHKSLDLEFERDDKYFIVGIKSGTSWGNADQISKLQDNFKIAREALRNQGITSEIVAVNGCIYGREATALKTDVDTDRTYFKYAGQEFWYFLSGDDELYRQIIAPIDEEAKRKDETFRDAYDAKINELTTEFSLNFVTNNQIDWLKLVAFVSAREKIALQRLPQQEEEADAQIKVSKRRARKAPQ